MYFELTVLIKSTVENSRNLKYSFLRVKPEYVPNGVTETWYFIFYYSMIFQEIVLDWKYPML